MRDVQRAVGSKQRQSTAGDNRYEEEQTHASFHCDLSADVSRVLGLENGDEVLGQCFVSSTLNVHSALCRQTNHEHASAHYSYQERQKEGRRVKGVATDLCLALDHAKVELVLVLEAGLFFELLDPVLLGVKVAGSFDIVGVFFEET